MNKIILFIAIICNACVCLAQVSLGPAAKFFTDMPLPMLEMIHRNRRLDMLDYYAADSIYQAPNGMEGLSHLEIVKPDFLKVCITSVSTLSISVLPVKNDTVYQCIYTLGSEQQAHDSEIAFYDKKYNRLDTKKFLSYPNLNSFILPDAKKSKEVLNTIDQAIPFPTITFTAIPTTTQLKAELTSEEIIGKDQYKKISSYLIPNLIYNWTGKRYQLQKCAK